MKKKIVVTGSTGKFGNHIKNVFTKHNFFFPIKNQFNIKKLQKLIKTNFSKING